MQKEPSFVYTSESDDNTKMRKDSLIILVNSDEDNMIGLSKIDQDGSKSISQMAKDDEIEFVSQMYTLNFNKREPGLEIELSYTV